MKTEKIAVLVSGGIDSAVTACLLQSQGYEVIGVFMMLMHLDDPQQLEHRRLQAEKVCQHLNIPFCCLPFRSHFKEQVYDPFMKAYAQGRTPNPCVRCNKTIKFGEAMDHVFDTLDVSLMATGHYVRIMRDYRGYYLKKGRDPLKDQSYVLYTLDQNQLARLVFPMGEYLKQDIKLMAKKLMPNITFLGESVDLCFISKDYHTLIPEKEGLIVDAHGKELGKHKGIHRFTIGQRQGLGIAAPHPLYVVNIIPESNQVIVGEKQDAYQNILLAHDIYSMIPGELSQRLELNAKIRYASPEQQCISEPFEDKLKVTFYQPQFAITPGQSVVFYDQDRLVGGGIIT
jgi:tRNA-uridine 2-sulfurtransferase